MAIRSFSFGDGNLLAKAVENSAALFNTLFLGPQWLRQGHVPKLWRLMESSWHGQKKRSHTYRYLIRSTQSKTNMSPEN